jgi:hypothetical protein
LLSGENVGMQPDIILEHVTVLIKGGDNYGTYCHALVLVLTDEGWCFIQYPARSLRLSVCENNSVNAVAL